MSSTSLQDPFVESIDDFPSSMDKSPAFDQCDYHRRDVLTKLASDLAFAAAGGGPFDEIIEKVKVGLTTCDGAFPANRSRFTAMTAAELNSSAVTETYLVEHILVEGQPCILAGPKKALKTSLLVDLGLSIAQGGLFLGKYRVHTPSRFLLCSGESGKATLKETARRIAAAMGKELGEVDDFLVCDTLPRFDSQQDLVDFEQFVADTGAKVVAVDPVYLTMPGEHAGNLLAQGRLLRGIAEIFQRQNATLILAHHTRKQSGREFMSFKPPELDDISWSGFSEFARQWILLGRRAAFEPGSGEHELWMSVGGSAGHSSLVGLDVSEGNRTDPGGRHWKVQVRPCSELKAESKSRRTDKVSVDHLDHDCASILGFLEKITARAATKSEMKEQLGLNARRLTPALEALCSDSRLELTKVKRPNGQSYDGYALPSLSDTNGHPDSSGLTSGQAQSG